MIVPSFSGPRSAEQPQSTILQFRQTQDGSGEHLTEAWPHQDTPSGSLGGCPGLCVLHKSCCRDKCSSWGSRGVTAWELQESVTGGCCWLVAVQSSAGQLLLLQLAFTGAGSASSEMLGTDPSSCRSCLPAVLYTCLDRVFVLRSTVHFHG